MTRVLALVPLALGILGVPTPHPALTQTEDSKLTPTHGGYGAEFGGAVAGAGDVDGDGYDDLIVGSPGYSVGMGAVYLYPGSASGIDAGTFVQLLASDAGILDEFGGTLAGAGDLDADGYDDVIIGAPLSDDQGSNAGSVYVVRGSASGLDVTTELELTASDGAEDANFGGALAGVGDVNGDGYHDIVVGAQGDDESAGAVYLFLGGAIGVDPASETKLTASDGAASDSFGSSVAAAGDVNGDGYDDLIVGSPGRGDGGAAYLYLGSAAGLGSETLLTASDGVLDDAFGIAVSGAGDVNGDGYDDVFIGASGVDDSGASAGATYLYLGSAAGLDLASEIELLASDGYGGDRFGYAVAGAGDRDGDGHADLLVGAYGDDDGGSGSGAAYTYPGNAKGPVAGGEVKLLASDADASDEFGLTLALAGDLNGDGAADLVVGAEGDDEEGSNSGAVYLFYGECTAVSTWYADSDGDGFGDPAVSAEACGAPSGHVADATDCDDNDASVYPGAPEIPDDGIDQDCSGEDAVGDTGGPVDDTDLPPDDTGDSGGDTEPPVDSDPLSDDTGSGPADTGEAGDPKDEKGCSSSARSAGGMLLMLLALAALVRRQRP